MIRGRGLEDPVYSIIEQFSATYSLDRRRERDESSYGSGERYEEDALSEDLYLYHPSQETDVVVSGEQLTGQLKGLALPDADVEVADRLTYGGQRYEITEVIATPSEGDHITTELRLERVEAEYTTTTSSSSSY